MFDPLGHLAQTSKSFTAEIKSSFKQSQHNLMKLKLKIDLPLTKTLHIVTTPYIWLNFLSRVGSYQLCIIVSKDSIKPGFEKLPHLSLNQLPILAPLAILN